MAQTKTLAQAAAAMKVSPAELQDMLSECGIYAQDELTRDQLNILIDRLEARQQENKQRALENLETVTARYTLMIDTCSLLHSEFAVLMSNLAPLLRRYGKALVVPSSVVGELRDLSSRKPELREQIDAASNLLVKLHREGLVKIFGNGGPFADHRIMETVIHYMTTTQILVITQDKNLAQDLIRQNQMRSIRSKSIAVSRINSYGFLSRFRPAVGEFAASHSSQQSNSVSAEVVPVCENLTLLPVDHFPREGDRVFGRDKRSALTLVSKLSSGGEGIIYDLGDGTVAKLYHPGRLTVARKEKLELMVSNPVNCPGVCWPRELLYNRAGQLIGYRMDRAQGTELQRCVFTRPALQSYFPHWKKLDTVRLCVTILEKICALHAKGIILGDINPLNILVVSPEEVWFVDCDSYQIGSHPCPVGTVRFTAPEIQKKPFAEFLRTMGHENFAVATLLFMIMLPGKSPYAQQGGTDLSETIRAMEFPYPFEGKRNANTPEGAWRFMWSHLPHYIKRFFYGTFQHGEAYSEEHTRLSAENWLDAFVYYRDLLLEGKVKDPASLEIFPDSLKIVNADDSREWTKCICSDCGEEFVITVGERDYFEAKGLSTPKRCPDCRKRRKLEIAGYDFGAAS